MSIYKTTSKWFRQKKRERKNIADESGAVLREMKGYDVKD